MKRIRLATRAWISTPHVSACTPVTETNIGGIHLTREFQQIRLAEAWLVFQVV